MTAYDLFKLMPPGYRIAFWALCWGVGIMFAWAWLYGATRKTTPPRWFLALARLSVFLVNFAILAGVVILVGLLVRATLPKHPAVAVAPSPVPAYFMAADSGYCQVSYYSHPEHGRKTAFGEIYDSLGMTAAMDMALPVFYGDIIELRSGATACTLRVTDRMSTATCQRFPCRDLDISQAAAKRLDLLAEGVRWMAWRAIKRNNKSK